MKQIVFFGTPQIAADVLEYVVTHSAELQVEILLVVTTPDKPVGRKHILTPSPVKVAGQKLGIPVHTGKIGDEVVRGALRRADHALLFAYGRIIPQDILDIPSNGFVNIHPSALPLYRGASPICFPILFGDRELGVTLMQMDADLDHGPIIAQELVPTIAATRNIIEHKLAEVACRMYHQFSILNSQFSITPQVHQKATYIFQLTRDDGFVEWATVQRLVHREAVSELELPVILKKYIAKNPTHAIDLNSLQWLTLQNLYFALTPWPGLWTKMVLKGEEKRVKILSVRDGDIIQVQIEGKDQVDFETFSREYLDIPG
ncbi:MAG: methionyl-tRNA formyltransferase [bacterium]